MKEEVVDMRESAQWEAEPEEALKIPEAYIKGLKYEIVVFGTKKEFTFRCANYSANKGIEWIFNNVVIDTSKRGPGGNITLKRITYHPNLCLVNIPFMVIPAPEDLGEGD